MKIDEFEFAETVNALSLAIGLMVASSPPEVISAFVAKIRAQIASSEPNTIRWRVYRQVVREVLGEIEDDPRNSF